MWNQAADALKEAGAKRVLPLNVSGPFHSSLLEQAGEELGKELEQVDFSDLQIPYVTNVTAEYVTDITKTKELLCTSGSIFRTLAAEYGTSDRGR